MTVIGYKAYETSVPDGFSTNYDYTPQNHNENSIFNILLGSV